MAEGTCANLQLYLEASTLVIFGTPSPGSFSVCGMMLCGCMCPAASPTVRGLGMAPARAGHCA